MQSEREHSSAIRLPPAEYDYCRNQVSVDQLRAFFRDGAAPDAIATVATDGGAPDTAVWEPPDVMALRLERQSCAVGDLGACLWGVTRPQPESERLKLLERACQLGPHGCVSLAYGLAGGHNAVPVDLPRARALAERLCNDDANPREVGPACVILAQITPDPERVRKLLARTCDFGWAGYHRAIYSNYWLPGHPTFYANCGDREHLGKPVRQRSRARR